MFAFRAIQRARLFCVPFVSPVASLVAAVLLIFAASPSVADSPPLPSRADRRPDLRPSIDVERPPTEEDLPPDGLFAQGQLLDQLRGVFSSSERPKAETWFGADVHPDYWAAYTGTTSAIFGDLNEPGLRLRSITGYGQSTYEADIGSGSQRATYWADAVFGEVLIGYEGKTGPTHWTVFLGGAILIRDVSPAVSVMQQGLSQIGPKIAIETWTNLPSNFAFKFNASFTHLLDQPVKFNIAKVEAMIAYRLSDTLLIGLETTIVSDRSSGADLNDGLQTDGQVAVGVHVDWSILKGTALRATAGIAAKQNTPSGSLKDPEPFVRLQLGIKY